MIRCTLYGAFWLAAVVLVSPASLAAEASIEYGLAARYPGDEGIERDPDVLFFESFEKDGWGSKWQERSGGHRKYGSIETRLESVRTGKRSLRLDIVAEAGKSAAGWMHHWWDGSDVAYLRYYCRLSKGDWSNQKIMQLHGHLRGKRFGQGAGFRPDGTSGAISAGTGSRPILYSYHPHQKSGFGDVFRPNQGSVPKINVDEWICYEVMIKLNDVGRRNGEQRLWVNGKLVIEELGMEWRKTDKMVINDIMQPTYTSVVPEPGHKRTLWIDSIVLAKKYIGPVVKTRRDPPHSSASGKSSAVQVSNVPARRARIAANYPNDEGIAQHPDVIAFDDFEVEGVAALEKEGWVTRYDWGLWKDGSGMKRGWSNYEIVANADLAFAGEKSLRKWAKTKDYGTKSFFDLPKGEETIFYRIYAKIPRRLPTMEIRLMGISGVRDGQETYQTYGAETLRSDGSGPFWVVLYLKNWQQAERIRDRYLAIDFKKTNTHYILYDTRNKVPVDRWFCLEMMLRLNTPGKHDGELRVWMDGKQVLTPEVDSLSLRRTGRVKIRTVNDQCYADSRQMTGNCEFLLDNRVVARRYIGLYQPPGK